MLSYGKIQVTSNNLIMHSHCSEVSFILPSLKMIINFSDIIMENQNYLFLLIPYVAISVFYTMLLNLVFLCFYTLYLNIKMSLTFSVRCDIIH